MDLKALNPNGNAFLVSFTKAKKTYKKFISPTLNDLGLTHNEFEILVFLQENLEYNTAKDIVEFSGLSKGLISRSIESLLKKEMLSIKKDDKDKRIFRLYISPSANETLNVLNKVSNRFFKLLLEDLKDEELMFFDEVLNKMIKNLNNLQTILFVSFIKSYFNIRPFCYLTSFICLNIAFIFFTLPYTVTLSQTSKV